MRPLGSLQKRLERLETIKKSPAIHITVRGSRSEKPFLRLVVNGKQSKTEYFDGR